MELQPETSPSTETERRKVLIVGHNPDILRHRTGKSVLMTSRAMDLLARNALFAGAAMQGLSRAVVGGTEFQLPPNGDYKTWQYFKCLQRHERNSYLARITAEADRLFEQSGFLGRKQRKHKLRHYKKIRRYVCLAEYGTRRPV